MQITSNILVQIDYSLWSSWHSEEDWSVFFAPIFQGVLSLLNITKSLEVSVLLTNDKCIQEMNKQFRDKDKPTNVLSFPQLSAQELANIQMMQQPILLGDIAMSFETIQRESSEQN